MQEFLGLKLFNEKKKKLNAFSFIIKFYLTRVNEI